MAKENEEDFDFLDNLLKGTEENLRDKARIDGDEGKSRSESRPSSPSSKKGNASNQEKKDSLSGDVDDDFSALEDELSEQVRGDSKPTKPADNVKDSLPENKPKERDPFLSMMDGLEYDEEIPDIIKRPVSTKPANANRPNEEKPKTVGLEGLNLEHIIKQKEANRKRKNAVPEEVTKEVDTGVDSGFEAIYDDNELEDIDNEFTEDEDEYISDAVIAALDWEPPPPKTVPGGEPVNEWIQTGWVGLLHLDKILTEAILMGASDVHIAAGLQISFTENGDIIRYPAYVIPDDRIMHELIHNGLLTHQQQAVLNTEYEYEGAYSLQYGPMAERRTRLTIGRTFGQYFMVFRIINEYIPPLEELKIDEEIVRWSHYPNGLFLLCGPTGSGKSTTLASIVHNLQMTTKKKIITIEKPVEYIYPDDAPSLVVQRNVGEDTRGFYEGLTSAMRQSPNVILLGEVRNTEEVTELLRAAETGHLAISTMHTNSVSTTINRIQNLFEGSEQRRIMSTLADTMRGIGNQVLVKTADGKGRFAVRELLTINEEIKKLIMAGDIQGIRQYQIDRKATMEHGLAEAYLAGRCKYEDALSQTADPILFDKLIKEGKLPEESAE